MNFIHLKPIKNPHMKKMLLLAVVACGIGFSVNAQTAAPQQTTPPIDPNAPVMKFKIDTMNFGTVVERTIVERDYVFTNTGKKPLVITSAAGSCHCTVPSF